MIRYLLLFIFLMLAISSSFLFDYWAFIIDLITQYHTELLDFIEKHGDDYTNAELIAGYTIDTRDRRSFTTSGFKTNLKGQLNIPGSDIEYFKLTFKTVGFFEIQDDDD